MRGVVECFADLADVVEITVRNRLLLLVLVLRVQQLQWCRNGVTIDCTVTIVSQLCRYAVQSSVAGSHAPCSTTAMVLQWRYDHITMV
jgi:hypothetical protein